MSEKLVASQPNEVALATPQVATSSPDTYSKLYMVDLVRPGSNETESCSQVLPLHFYKTLYKVSSTASNVRMNNTNHFCSSRLKQNEW